MMFCVALLRECICYTFHVFPSHCPLLLGFLDLHTGPEHAMAGTRAGDAGCPAGPPAPISALEMLPPATGVCTPSFAFSSMLLKTSFQSPSNRCLGSSPQHMDHCPADGQSPQVLP